MKERGLAWPTTYQAKLHGKIILLVAMITLSASVISTSSQAALDEPENEPSLAEATYKQECKQEDVDSYLDLLDEDMVAFFHEMANDDYKRLIPCIPIADLNNLKATKVVVCNQAELPVNTSPLACLSLMTSLGPHYHEMFTILLERAGIEVDPTDDLGRTPLLVAASQAQGPSSADIGARLLARGADIAKCDKQGNTALILASGAPSSQMNADFVSWLLASGADPNVASQSGTTALLQAAIYGNLDALTLLLKHNALIDHVDSHGFTALNYAIHYSKTTSSKAAVELLLAHNPQVGLHMEGSAASALHIAQPGYVSPSVPMGATSSSSTRDIFGLILKQKPNINLSARDGNTALMDALQAKKARLRTDDIKAMFALGADLQQQSQTGDTLFAIALNSKYEALSIDLIKRALVDERSEASPAANPSPNSPSPFLYAVRHAATPGFLQLIEEHLAAKPDLTKRDKDGLTPLMIASRYASSGSSSEALGLLLSYASPEDLMAESPEKRNALVYAALYNAAGSSLAALKRLLDRMDKETTSNGQRLFDAPTSTGLTPLMYAVLHAGDTGSVEAVRLILSYHPDLEQKADHRNHGWTALIIACTATGSAGTGSIDAVHALLDAGAHIDAQGQNEASVLANSIFNYPNYSGTDTIRLLLERGANVMLKGSHGTSFDDLVAMKDDLWPIFDDFTRDRGDNMIDTLLQILKINSPMLNTTEAFIRAQFDEAYQSGELSRSHLEQLATLDQEGRVLRGWFTVDKRQRLHFLLKRSAYVGKLKALLRAKASTLSAGAYQTMAETCSICEADLVGQETRAPAPVCRKCMGKWYKEGGAIAGLGITRPAAESTARAQAITSDDLHAWGFSDEEVVDLEIARLREDLKSLPNWKSCPTEDCFNGRCLNAEDDLYLDCTLCGKGSCLGCGDDHRGSCDKYERTCAQIRELVEAGKRKPTPANPESLDGKFRPCYYCGVLTERIDGCSTMTCGSCKQNWDWNYGAPEHNPRYRGQQVHEFEAYERNYEPLVEAHF